VDMMYQDDAFTQMGAVDGNWVNLTPYLTEEEQADFGESQRGFIETHGGIYRIPWFAMVDYMYYRKDLFKKEGLSPPKTWDEFLEIGKKLTKDLDGDGEIDQWGYVTAGKSSLLYNAWVEFLAQVGGEQYQVARKGRPTPEAKKALEFMSKLLNIAPSPLSTI